ncbi:hypothetical protein WDW86_19875, partial [Bdellovibrionota bacterium FG-2]
MSEYRNPRRIIFGLFFLFPCFYGSAWAKGKAAEVGKSTWTYRTHPHETLSEISIRLYGTHRLWPQIAKWNSLKPPYRVLPERNLILKRKPTVSAKEGEQYVLNLWRAYFALPPKESKKSEGSPLALKVSPAPKTKVQERAEIKDQFLAAIQNENREQVDAADSEGKSAEEYLAEGEKFLKDKKFEAAVESFKKARETNPTLTAPWFYEIRAFRLLKRDDDARKTASLLLKLHPEFQALPLFKNLFNGPE